MAAAEVSSNPYQTYAADEDGFKMNQEESSDDHDHNQQDGLGQIQQQQEQEEHQQSYQEDFHEDSDRPETPNERSQTPDYKSESPDPARAATPDTAGGDAESFEDDKETDDYYNQATQQALLQQELQKLKDEGILPQSDEPVFDYDIAERVKQLNAELEQEGATPEKINRRIKFSDSIVEFAPSPDLSEDKEDRTEDQMDPNDLEVARLTLNDDPHHEDGENGQRLPGDTGGSDVSASGDTSAEGLPNGSIHLDRLSNEQNGGGASNNTSGTDQPDGVNLQTSQQSDEQKQDEQVLLERNGQFELVNVKDLSAEERFMMGLEPVVEHNSNNSANSSSSPGAVGFQPSPPPRKPRPSTATGQAGVRRQQLQPRRIQSAKTHREVHGADGQSSRDVDWDARSSGYGMSPEQKAGFRKAYRMQLQRQREEQERQEEEKRREKEESEEAFQWWLNKKREDDKQKRKEERERKKREQEEQEERDPEAVFQAWVEKKKQVLKEEREKAAIMEMIRLQEDQEGEVRDPDETYKAWLDNKKEQAKFERQLRRKMEEEKERAFYVRDRKDCDKAYKEWLRSKNSQLREEKSMKRSSASQSQKRAKLSRKSRQLAKALQVAETYRYTDYYGYRF